MNELGRGQVFAGRLFEIRQAKAVILSAAKNLCSPHERFFAALRMTPSILMDLLLWLWQNLVRPQGVEVHGVSGLVVGMQDAVGVQNELGVAVPGCGVLPAPLATRISV